MYTKSALLGQVQSITTAYLLCVTLCDRRIREETIDPHRYKYGKHLIDKWLICNPSSWTVSKFRECLWENKQAVKDHAFTSCYCSEMNFNTEHSQSEVTLFMTRQTHLRLTSNTLNVWGDHIVTDVYLTLYDFKLWQEVTVSWRFFSIRWTQAARNY